MCNKTMVRGFLAASLVAAAVTVPADVAALDTVYVACYNGQDKILSASVDGSNVKPTFLSLPANVIGTCVDSVHSNIYWTDYSRTDRRRQPGRQRSQRQSGHGPLGTNRHRRRPAEPAPLYC